MAKGRAAQRQDGRPHLGVGDDLDAEDVGKARPAVVAKGAEDEVFALLVEDEHAGEHRCGARTKKKREKGKGKEMREAQISSKSWRLVFCRDEVATATAVRLGARLVRVSRGAAGAKACWSPAKARDYSTKVDIYRGADCCSPLG